MLESLEDSIVRAVGGGVGFVAEYREHRKQRETEMKRSVSATPSERDAITDLGDTIAVVDDEAAWALDEAMEEKLAMEGRMEPEEHNTDRFVFVDHSRQPGSVTLTYRKPLPFPVIVPQRRPREQTRGFVRAYAPALADCGISQDTFLSFLKDFHDSCKSSPVFAVAQVSSVVLGQAPEVLCKVLATAIGAGGLLVDKALTRMRTNEFLDRANRQLFGPAGLFAVIMKYKPDSEMDPEELKQPDVAEIQQVDVSTNNVMGRAKLGFETKMADLRGTRSFQTWNGRLKSSSGTTEGTVAMPQAAPLIFPDLARTRDGPETFRDRVKDFTKVFADYNDRRAQIGYRSKDPASLLAVPSQQSVLKSEYADPNHAMYHNGFRGLVTRGMKVRSSNKATQESGESQDVEGLELPKKKAWSDKLSTGKHGMLAKVIRKDVLYLMIMNLPSETGSANAGERQG